MRYLTRSVWWLSVFIVVSGCGAFRHLTWPAHVSGVEGFETNSQKGLFSAIDYFNQNAGAQLVDPQSSNEGFPIYFVEVESSPESPRRAGLAIVEDDRCTIELVRELFDDIHRDTIVPVVAHELGHCAGLGHDPTKGEIMYESAGPLSTYTKNAITRFMDSVKAHLILNTR